MNRIYSGLAVALLVCGMLLSAKRANAQMSGNYSINATLPASATNFVSFNAATSSLISQGVSGPVNFDVAMGTYTEQVIIPQITGASTINRITFSGHGAALTFNPTVSAERAVIKLNGADFIVIDSLNISATGTTATEYGYAVHLLNAANNNTVKNCGITLNKATTVAIAGNYAGVLINAWADTTSKKGNPNCNENTILNNRIVGGYYGVCIVADSAVSTVTGNYVKGNSIQDFYHCGVHLNGTLNTIIDSNDISRPARPASPTYLFWGVSLEKGNSGVKITRNKFHDPFGSNTAASSGTMAIYSYNSPATAALPNEISNNVVYNVNSSGIATGFDFTNSPNQRFYHNSVSLDDINSGAFGSARGFSIFSSNNMTIVNNNVSITRGGAFSSKHCIYIGTSASTGLVVNNNNWYIAAGSTNHLGYYTANRTNLSDWQTASGFDLAGLSVNPSFTSLSNLFPANTALAGTGQISTVLQDIAGVSRSTTAPTPGAYEILTCPLPTSLSTSNIITNSAQTAWNSGASNHRVQYGPTGFIIGSGTVSGNLVTNGYLITNLLPGTTYQFYVRDSCGPGNLSGWAGPFSFTTACAPLAVNLGNDTTICAGATINLNAGFPGSTYVWNNAVTTQTLTTGVGGTYHVTVTGANQCTGSDTIVITVQAAASFTGINATPSINTPRQVSFSAANAQNVGLYTWNFGDGNTSTLAAPIHTYAADGSYNVQLIVSNNCGVDSISRQVTVTSTGVDENLIAAGVQVYPNPATAKLHIAVQTAANYSYSVVDAAGRTVISGKISSQNQDVDVSPISGGLYVLRLQSAQEVLQMKFSKR